MGDVRDRRRRAPALHQLCDTHTSTGDLLELTDRYQTLVLAGVPALARTNEDARRRFADLVDVCWDRDIRLVLLTTLSPDSALDAALTDLDRMTSRLNLLRHLKLGPVRDANRLLHPQGATPRSWVAGIVGFVRAAAARCTGPDGQR